MPPTGDHRLSQRVLMVALGACVLVVGLAVVAAAGGLERVEPAGLPVVAAGERIEGQPWTVTVARAVLAVDLKPATLQEEDGYWLAVVADVEITANESRGDVYDILCITAVEGLTREHQESSLCPGGITADDVRLFRDGSAASTLHPGLPERLAFLWELAGDASPPTEVHVEIVGKTYRESSLTGQMEWLDEAPRAQLTVPVEDRRDEA